MERESLGDIFGTAFVIEAKGENPAEAARRIVRDLASLVRPPFKLEERVGHMAPSPTKFGLAEDPTASSLHGARDLTGIRLISLNVDQDLDGGNACYIEIRIPPPGGFEVDEWSPPWMAGSLYLYGKIGWDFDLLSGNSFKRPEFARPYADLLLSIRTTVRPRWLADGANSGKWDSRYPRFTYYRIPEEFARSLMLRFSIQGDEKAVAKDLREIADGDLLTRRVHSINPKAPETEASDPLVGHYKRLRFPSEGGVILESGRYGADYEELGHDRAFFRTNADVSAMLVEMLVERGVVRPLAKQVERGADGGRR